MRSFTLQDWTTVRGTSSITTFTQSDRDYLDMGPFEDAVLWVDVREATSGGGAFNFNFENAPTREEALFNAQGSGFATVVAAVVGVTVTPVIFDNLGPYQQPIARWLRWRITNPGAGSTWSTTFRVLVTAHSLSI